MKTNIIIEPRERDTILAALRLWQDRNLPPRPPDLGERRDAREAIAREHGPALDTEEIDALCERLRDADLSEARMRADMRALRGIEKRKTKHL